MWRWILTIVLLVLGATALARGLYLQRQISQQLDTGAMGAIRSWIMWSTTDGRELVGWYRQVTPWLIGGGCVLLLSGAILAIRMPTKHKKNQGEKAKEKKRNA
jgi:hypothetical protein